MINIRKYFNKLCFVDKFTEINFSDLYFVMIKYLLL